MTIILLNFGILLSLFMLIKYYGIIRICTFLSKSFFGIIQEKTVHFSIFGHYYIPFSSFSARKWFIKLYNLNKTSQNSRIYYSTKKFYNANSKYVIDVIDRDENTYYYNLLLNIDIYRKENNEWVLFGSLKSQTCKRLFRKYMGFKKTITFYSNSSNLPSF